MKLYEHESSNPIFSHLHRQRTQEILLKFPLLREAGRTNFLSLWKYTDACPERFFSVNACEVYLERLLHIDRTHKETLARLLQVQEMQINNAYRHVHEICSFSWHDEVIQSRDDYEQLIIIDQDVHPSYLRLVEAVYRPLLRIIAHFSRIDRGKDVEGLDLYQIVEELDPSQYNHVLSPYDHLMRNGIAHGAVHYTSESIVYEDKRGNAKEIRVSEVIRTFDDLLDVCNGLLLAFSLFMLTREDADYKLPKNLLTDELQEETKTPYWEVVGCLPSTRLGYTQLVTYIRTNTIDGRKIVFSLLQTAKVLGSVAPGYDRYFFSLRSEKALPGFAAFDGQKLAQKKMTNAPLENYWDALEKDTVFFAPKHSFPKVFAILETFQLAYKAHWPETASTIRERLGLAKVIVRNSNIHRNGWGSVLSADVVIENDSKPVDQDVVRRNCNRIVRKSLRRARRNTSSLSAHRYLPLAFCRISVYQKDYRARRLVGFGLAGDLICTVQARRMKRIRSPDIVGATIELMGRYRIAWNRWWLEEQAGSGVRLASVAAAAR